MALTRLVVHSGGVRRLLNEPGVVADLQRRGRAIAAVAGEGNRVDTEPTGTRARVEVVTATTEARVREAKERSLTRAVDAGR
jgi:hypothetical protein